MADEVTTPVASTKKESFLKSRYGWTLIAFFALAALVSGLLIWQLGETSPQVWCALADDSSEGLRTACLSTLLKLVELKDHAIIGLLWILGITVVSVVAVAVGVRISAAGPGGTHVDVGAENTSVQNGDTRVDIPTPPSGDKK